MKENYNESRRVFLKTTVTGFMYAALTESALAKIVSKNKRMNVLFIAVDDLKPMLKAYGYKNIISPNIDKLAEEGVVFKNNQCQWPVCGASRASILTGLMPESTGVMGFQKIRKKHPDIVTMPQYFKENGYETAAVGKVFDPRTVKSRREDDPLSWSIPYKPVHGSKYDKNRNNLSYMAPDVDVNELIDGQILQGGIKLMRQLAKQDKPFFLAVGFKKPHLPFIAPKKYWDLYDEDRIELAKYRKKAKNACKYGWRKNKEIRKYSDVPDKGKISEDKQRKLIHGYYACVSYIDDLIGRLLAELKKLKLDKNTIIVLWGDHGFHLGDHSLWAKHSDFEQATRAPLIIYDPRSKNKGVSTESPTEFLDVFPTLCDLTGLEKPDNLEGKSLVPILKNPKAEVREGAITLFKHKGALGYSLRTKRYRYILWIKRKTKKIAGEELYDYKTDPLETENIAVYEKNKKLIRKLRTIMLKEGKGCKLLKEAFESIE